MITDNFYSYFDANTMSYFRKFLQKHQGTYIHNYISRYDIPWFLGIRSFKDIFGWESQPETHHWWATNNSNSMGESDTLTLSERNTTFSRDFGIYCPLCCFLKTWKKIIVRLNETQASERCFSTMTGDFSRIFKFKEERLMHTTRNCIKQW